MINLFSVLNASVDGASNYQSLQTIDHCGPNLAAILSSSQMFLAETAHPERPPTETW